MWQDKRLSSTFTLCFCKVPTVGPYRGSGVYQDITTPNWKITGTLYCLIETIHIYGSADVPQYNGNLLKRENPFKNSSLLITRWLLFDYVCIMPCSEHFRFNQAPCENLFWVICLTVIAFAEWKKIEMRIFTWSHLGILKLRTSRTELKEGHLSKVPLLLPPSFLFPPSSVALVFVYFEFKGAVTAVQFIFFISPITRPRSLWNLK